MSVDRQRGTKAQRHTVRALASHRQTGPAGAKSLSRCKLSKSRRPGCQAPTMGACRSRIHSTVTLPKDNMQSIPIYHLRIFYLPLTWCTTSHNPFAPELSNTDTSATACYTIVSADRAGRRGLLLGMVASRRFANFDWGGGGGMCRLDADRPSSKTSFIATGFILSLFLSW